MEKVAALTALPVVVVIKNGNYHLLIEGFARLKKANIFIGQLAKIGFQGDIIKKMRPVNHVLHQFRSVVEY